jgi:hypothetical protein
MKTKIAEIQGSNGEQAHAAQRVRRFGAFAAVLLGIAVIGFGLSGCVDPYYAGAYPAYRGNYYAYDAYPYGYGGYPGYPYYGAPYGYGGYGASVVIRGDTGRRYYGNRYSRHRGDYHRNGYVNRTGGAPVSTTRTRSTQRQRTEPVTNE